jgi:hypothetical protein
MEASRYRFPLWCPRCLARSCARSAHARGRASRPHKEPFHPSRVPFSAHVVAHHTTTSMTSISHWRFSLLFVHTTSEDDVRHSDPRHPGPHSARRYVRNHARRLPGWRASGCRRCQRAVSACCSTRCRDRRRVRQPGPWQRCSRPRAEPAPLRVRLRHLVRLDPDIASAVSDAPPGSVDGGGGWNCARGAGRTRWLQEFRLCLFSEVVWGAWGVWGCVGSSGAGKSSGRRARQQKNWTRICAIRDSNPS